MMLTSQLVRSYKGAAVSIILLFLLERRSLNQSYLRRYTGYGDEAVSDALELLRDGGMITQTGRYEWAMLGDGMRQLPIGSDSDATGSVLPEALPADSERETEPKKERIIEQIVIAPDQSELTAHACMHDSFNLNHESCFKDHACLKDSPAPEKTELGAEIPEIDDSQEVSAEDVRAELEKALEKAGFRDPGLSRLRKIPGLTGRDVRYQVGRAPSLGAAMYRLEHGWRVAGDFEPGAPRMTCSRCGKLFAADTILKIGGRWVDLECMSEAEYERYRKGAGE